MSLVYILSLSILKINLLSYYVLVFVKNSLYLFFSMESIVDEFLSLDMEKDDIEGFLSRISKTWYYTKQIY